MLDLERVKRALEETAVLDQALLAENPRHIVVAVVLSQVLNNIGVAVTPKVVDV